MNFFDKIYFKIFAASFAVAYFSLTAQGFLLAATANMGIALDVTSEVGVRIQWATPELRYGLAETNDDTNFFITVRDPVSHVIVYAQPDVSTTLADGTFMSSTIRLVDLPEGTYDVGIKTDQHLTKILRSVPLSEGVNILNFTRPDNSAPKGTDYLLGGDINLAGISTSTFGDDKVNALDLTTLLADYNGTNPNKYTYRSNLTRDTKVNSLDITIILKNFNKSGDQ